MDPITITSTHWAQISQFVNFMFYSVGVVIIIATNLLIGYIFIPSLIDSQDSPLAIVNGAKLESPKFISFLLKIQKACYAVCVIGFFALKLIAKGGSVITRSILFLGINFIPSIQFLL